MDKLLNFGFENGVDLWRSEEMMLAQVVLLINGDLTPRTIFARV
jgi:hypothetical protein